MMGKKERSRMRPGDREPRTAAENASRPEFVYRLATPDEWRSARATGVVPTREIDDKDGAMHLSTRAQFLETANRHFAGARELYGLQIPWARIAGHATFEWAPSAKCKKSESAFCARFLFGRMMRKTGSHFFASCSKRGAYFPHLYGTLLTEHVARVIRLEPTDAGFRFGGVL
jgi:uncharacterized protein (DUF952 family)